MGLKFTNNEAAAYITSFVGQALTSMIPLDGPVAYGIGIRRRLKDADQKRVLSESSRGLHVISKKR